MFAAEICLERIVDSGARHRSKSAAQLARRVQQTCCALYIADATVVCLSDASERGTYQTACYKCLPLPSSRN